MSNITKVRIKQTDGTYSEEYPIGVLAENVDMGNSTNLSTKISTMDTAIGGKAPTNHASANTTYGVATSGAYGHVKIVDNYMTVPQATGPFAASTQAVVNAYSALNTNKAPNNHATSETTYGVATSAAYGHVKIVDNYITAPTGAGPYAASTDAVINAYAAASSATNTLSSTYYAAITPKGYVAEGGSSLWTPIFGGSFSSSESVCYIRQIIDHVFMITFAVKVSAAISASVDRNIITNLPLAATRVYVPATIISFNENGPTTTKSVVLAIRPEDSAANSGRILKIEAGLNPYSLVAGDAIYSTFVLIGNK